VRVAVCALELSSREAWDMNQDAAARLS